MPMSGAPNDGSFSLILNGKETRAMAGNPFPADPQFCQIAAKIRAWRRIDL
jgi:hypothetical protein